ncbi:MAG: HAD family phosphatase [Deltaproteobacteria bacterium]|nr:HAD family phosphatase [Deltaproteobacteria bacterium]
MDAYDAIIFDFGRVLTAFAPDEIARTLLGDPSRALRVRRAIFAGPHWRALEQGLVTEAGASARISEANPDEAEGVRRFFEHYKDFLGPLPSGVSVVDKVRKAGLRIYGLPNLSREAWEVMQQRPAFLELFDGVVVSSHERLIKPDPAIFEILLERYSLIPSRCVFIDDVPTNVEAARRLGIDGLHFENHRQITRALIRRGILAAPVPKRSPGTIHHSTVIR